MRFQTTLQRVGAYLGLTTYTVRWWPSLRWSVVTPPIPFGGWRSRYWVFVAATKVVQWLDQSSVFGVFTPTVGSPLLWQPACFPLQATTVLFSAWRKISVRASRPYLYNVGFCAHLRSLLTWAFLSKPFVAVVGSLVFPSEVHILFLSGFYILMPKKKNNKEKFLAKQILHQNWPRGRKRKKEKTADFTASVGSPYKIKE